MNLVKKLTLFGLMTAALSGIPSCSEKSTTTEYNNNETTKPQLKNIVFKTLCEDTNGLVVGFPVRVAIYDEITKQRMMYGSTLPNGGFCSPKLDISRSYSIEFYYTFQNQSRCLGKITNLTYQNNPKWWSDDCTSGYSASEDIGKIQWLCWNLGERSDCWGQ